jgi:hypothetical protein
MSLGTWTTQALTSGRRSRLVVERGEWRGFIVIMKHGNGDMQTEEGDTPDEALAKLEIALLEDCAQEMREKGAV